jgi:hypothetical protein
MDIRLHSLICLQLYIAIYLPSGILLSLFSHQHSAEAMLSQLSLVHTLIPNIDAIHFNIILAFTSYLSSDLLLYIVLSIL